MDFSNYSTQIEITKICRICLQKDQDTIDLFSEDKNAKEILDKIYLCFQLTLSFDEGFPSAICVNCINELNIAHNFRKKCETFHNRFDILMQHKVIEVKLNNAIDKFESTENFTGFEHEYEEVDEVPIERNYDLENIYNNGFMCSICNKTLKSGASLLKHQISMHQKRKHHGKVSGFGIDRRYHCTKCSYNTPHSQTLVNHMRKHSGDRPFHCECGKSFTQSASLNAHRKTHSNATYFTCSMCGKQFKHAFSLKKHLDVHEIGKFNCDICQKQLKSRQTLQDHMYRHYNIRNYNCEDCGKTFVTCSELLNHKRKHNVIKRVECHLCGYKTHTKKSLIIHLKRHTGDKSYKCDICHVSFFTNGDLQRHKRVHTKDKPFPCPACTQRFTHSTSLNKHMKSMHGIDCKWADIKIKDSSKESIIIKIVKDVNK
ncbi:unnamed protein product, partial [Brenthis ino]